MPPPVHDGCPHSSQVSQAAFHLLSLLLRNISPTSFFGLQSHEHLLCVHTMSVAMSGLAQTTVITGRSHAMLGGHVHGIMRCWLDSISSDTRRLCPLLASQPLLPVQLSPFPMSLDWADLDSRAHPRSSGAGASHHSRAPPKLPWGPRAVGSTQTWWRHKMPLGLDPPTLATSHQIGLKLCNLHACKAMPRQLGKIMEARGSFSQAF